jgi:hypothetical protein
MLAAAAAAQSLDPGDALSIESRRLFLKAGSLFPLYAWPVPKARMIQALSELADTNAGIAEECAALAARISPGAGARFFVAPGAHLELRAGQIPGVEGDDGLNGIDLSRDHLSQPPLVTLRYGADGAMGLSGDVTMQLRKEWAGDSGSWNNLPIIDPESSNPVQLDNYTMDRADLAYSAPGFDLFFGRAPVHFGPAGFSSLSFSSALPYLDRIHLRSAGGVVGFDWLVASIPAARAVPWQQDVNPNQGVSGDARYGWEGSDTHTEILVAYKRIHANFGAFALGIAENVIYSRPNNAFQIGDFVPFLDWHGSSFNPNNLAFLVDAEWAPLPGLALYASLGLDDIGLGGAGIADSGVPTIPAAVLGAEALLDAWGGDLYCAFEAGYAHYLWGNFDGYATAGWDPNPLARAIYRMKSDYGALLLPLTSPYGPGALWLKLVLERGVPEIRAAVGLKVESLWKQPGADLIRTPFAADPSLEEMPFALFSLGLSVAADWKPFEIRLTPGFEISPSGFFPTIELRLSLGDTFVL